MYLKKARVLSPFIFPASTNPHTQISASSEMSLPTTINSTPPLYPGKTLVELACAAYRVNGGFFKDTITTDVAPTDSGEELPPIVKLPNKILIRNSLFNDKPIPEIILPSTITRELTLLPEDTEMAVDLRKYYQRLTLDLLAGTTEFYVKMHLLLEAEEISYKEIGFIAYWPAAYVRDKASTVLKRKLRFINSQYIHPLGGVIYDADSEIIEVKYSDKYDSWKMTALIGENLVFWWKATPGILGPCVIIKAKIKNHMDHWEHHIPCTQLNYVKAAQ
jgi:hypothetical protein